MERDLQIVFKTNDESTKYITVQDVRDDLTAAEVEPIAALIVANDIFTMEEAKKAASYVEARVVVKEVTVLV